MSETVRIGYGVILPSIDEQLNAQGYMLTCSSKPFELYREAINRLRLAQLITEGEADKAYARLQKRIVKSIKKFQA